MSSALTTIEVKAIVRDIPRPDFVDLHHKVVFVIRSDELEPIEVSIWVSRLFPDDQLVAVARTFLAGRLADMTKVALKGALLPQEINSMWASSKPH